MVCPHMGGPLEAGTSDGETIVCPWHGYRFSLITGELVDNPNERSLALLRACTPGYTATPTPRYRLTPA